MESLPVIKVQRAVVTSLVAIGLAAAGHAAERHVYAITHVNVVPMDQPRILRDQTVLVVNDVIAAIGPYREVPIEKGAQRIEGRGNYLMPGLADMHVHIGAEVPGMGITPPDPLNAPVAGKEWESALERELLLYLANGVTTVRNMAGSPTTLSLMHRLEAGEINGPRIYTASPIIDGNPPSNPIGAAHVFDDPRQATQLAAQLHQAGYQFLKVYNQLSAESYYALAAAAHAISMPVVGHVPFQAGFPGILKARQDSVEHLRGYDFDPLHPPTVSLAPERFTAWFRVSDETMREDARLTATAGIYNCPTLSIVYDGMVSGAARTTRATRPEMKLLPEPLHDYMLRGYIPDNVAEAMHRTVGPQQKMIMALSNAGAPLMTGTDTPLELAVPGFELHREMELLVLTGLSPYQALRAATRTPQEFLEKTLKEGKRRGLVAVGFDADLLLVGGDPLTDVSNTRKLRGLMLRGKWYSAEGLRLD
jgi:imidazolonepropionase-like amidohydrolase